MSDLCCEAVVEQEADTVPSVDVDVHSTVAMPVAMDG